VLCQSSVRSHVQSVNSLCSANWVADASENITKMHRGKYTDLNSLYYQLFLDYLKGKKESLI
jgi:hypothetical protein